MVVVGVVVVVVAMQSCGNPLHLPPTHFLFTLPVAMYPAGQEIVATEKCELCKQARQDRRRVIPEGHAEAELRKEPFTRAPAVFSCNVPKYFTVILRAR